MEVSRLSNLSKKRKQERKKEKPRKNNLVLKLFFYEKENKTLK